MSIFTTILVAIFASSGLWSVATLLIQHRLNNKNKQAEEWTELIEEQEKMNKLVLGIGHDRICFLGMSYVNRGYITKDEYEDLVNYLYNPYKNLTGNGTADFIMEKIKDLPICSNAEEYEQLIKQKQQQQYNIPYNSILTQPLKIQ